MSVIVPGFKRRPRSEKDRVLMMAMSSLLLICAGGVALWTFFATEPASTGRTQPGMVSIDRVELSGRGHSTLNIDAGGREYRMNRHAFDRRYPEDTMVARLQRGGRFELWTLEDDQTRVVGISGPGIDVPPADGIADLNDDRATLPWFGGVAITMGFVTAMLMLARRRRMLESQTS